MVVIMLKNIHIGLPIDSEGILCFMDQLVVTLHHTTVSLQESRNTLHLNVNEQNGGEGLSGRVNGQLQASYSVVVHNSTT